MRKPSDLAIKNAANDAETTLVEILARLTFLKGEDWVISKLERIIQTAKEHKATEKINTDEPE